MKTATTTVSRLQNKYAEKRRNAEEKNLLRFDVFLLFDILRLGLFKLQSLCSLIANL